MSESAIVKCATCGTFGKVVFEGDQIVKTFFVCKCPRPPVESGERGGEA